MATKKWTVVECDSAKYLRTELGRKLERLELSKTTTPQVLIGLDDELYAALSKNPTWLQKIQSTATNGPRCARRNSRRRSGA